MDMPQSTPFAVVHDGQDFGFSARADAGNVHCNAVGAGWICLHEGHDL